MPGKSFVRLNGVNPNGRVYVRLAAVAWVLARPSAKGTEIHFSGNPNDHEFITVEEHPDDILRGIVDTIPPPQ